MNNPEYVKIDNKKYKINTDFRIAIECNSVATDDNIGEYEKSLAIIYLLFGDEGLQDFHNHERLMELGQKYLLCGKEPIKEAEEPDMDYAQDMDYIEASFMSDYQIDLTNIKMHWWTFNNLMNGLSNSELGNCCVLNRIRSLRNYDVSQIKDKKEKDRILKAKEQVALKKREKEIVLTKTQEESAKRFRELIGR